MRGRSIVIVAVGAMAIAGCGRQVDVQGASSPSPARTPTPAPTATPRPTAPPETPPLLVAQGREVAVYREGRPENIGSVAGTARTAVDAGRWGTAVEEVFGPDTDRSRLVLLDDAGERTVIDTPEAEQRNLFDSAVVDGEVQLLYRTYSYSHPEDEFPKGELFLQPVGTSAWHKVSGAAGGLSSIASASYGDGIIAAQWWHDLDYAFTYYRPDGTRVDALADPTEDLPYAGPPAMVEPVLAPQGNVLAYLEGAPLPCSTISPHGSASPSALHGWSERDVERTTGDWELVAIDLEDGEEQLRVRIAPRGERMTRLDFDGRWAVLSREECVLHSTPSPRPRAEPTLPTLVVDTHDRAPEPKELSNVVGMTTIVDLRQPSS